MAPSPAIDRMDRTECRTGYIAEAPRGRMVIDPTGPCREGSVQTELNLLNDRIEGLGQAIHELRKRMEGVLRSTPTASPAKAANGHTPTQSKLAAQIHDATNVLEGFRDNIVDMLDTLDLS